jgi:hypothetical protein
MGGSVVSKAHGPIRAIKCMNGSEISGRGRGNTNCLEVVMFTIMIIIELGATACDVTYHLTQ